MTGREQRANALRVLSMDAVQAARSGHPGAPMGMADIAEVLWHDHLRHDPALPEWPDRDRFVLSNGHASALLYSLLHLSGYDLPIEELRNFRQLHSKTPGHPEHGLTPGVETTTGPLGQGLANAVGMALAERLLAAEFNRPGHQVIDHHTYVFVGDGCLMEGISHEACSLAGTLGLGKLIVIYDDNQISIDGPVKGWFTDDTPGRFGAYGWQVIPAVNGHDPAAIDAALIEARQTPDRPTLICCRTIIGRGAPHKAGSAGVHGAPLGEEEIAAARAELNWPFPPFEVPPELRSDWDCRARGAQLSADWQQRFEDYRRAHPALASELERRLAGELPQGWVEGLNEAIGALQDHGKDLATRQASKEVIELLARDLPELIGGSADLSDSNKTLWSDATTINAQDSGNYLHYGVREFGMTAICSGLALHGGFLPFAGTFLTFSDYARNALRLAAMMEQRVVAVYSHDSIGLGEDGPTHQPIEHLASLRLMPNVSVWRPCDLVETAIAWREAVLRHGGPTALVLSRQTLPHQRRDHDTLEQIARGGYILADSEGPLQAILLATGSEVAIVMAARERLQAAGVGTRVISLPNIERFAAQALSYRQHVLPPEVGVRVSLEAGVTGCWRALVGDRGQAIGIDSYGASAPANELYEHFGITAAAVVTAVEKLLRGGADPAGA